MYVMFLATAPVYIQHLYTEKKLTYIPAFQTCPFWGSETGLKPHLRLQLCPVGRGEPTIQKTVCLT